MNEPAPRGVQQASFDSNCSIEKNPLARRVFFEYGSIFVTTTGVRLPRTCIFRSAEEVSEFQKTLETGSDSFNGVEIELQKEAIDQLILARVEAADKGLKITPLDGKIAGRRSYADTVDLWNSRFYRALDHWSRKGRISRGESAAARFLKIPQQVDLVVAWEENGIFFSTDFSKSIFHSVAPPGTSQHLSLLAFDVVEAGNPSVRKLLNKYGWFQTIRTDQPHFTYLGVPEAELPKRGLRNVYHKGNTYWVPNTDLTTVLAQNARPGSSDH